MFSEILYVIFLALDLTLLSSSRLLHCIRLVALQGLLIGLMPLADAVLRGELRPSMALMAMVSIVVKAVLLPRLLSRAMRRAQVNRELEPLAGYSVSTLAALAMVALAFVMVRSLPLSEYTTHPLSVPVSLITMLTGLFLIIARRKALTQALGFLVFENGITVFGIGMTLENSFIVELGILLDVLALVFIMGIAVFHINREFAHIDTDRLNHLGDWSAQEPELKTEQDEEE